MLLATSTPAPVAPGRRTRAQIDRGDSLKENAEGVVKVPVARRAANGEIENVRHRK